MSDVNPNDPDFNSPDADDGDDAPNQGIKKLREKAKRTDEAEERNATLERELAFLRAGVDTSTDAAQILMRGWEGDFETDKIREVAGQMGLIKTEGSSEVPSENPDTPTDPPDAELDEGEEAAIARNQTLAGTSDTQPEPTADPYAEGAKIFEDAVAGGMKSEEAFGAALNAVVAAGVDGDQRVIVPEVVE